MRFMSTRHLTKALLLALIILPFAPSSGAYDSPPLPSFQVTNLDGQPVQSAQLSAKNQWLLVYVQPNCRPCAELFKAFQKKEAQPDLSDKVIVVVGGGTVEQAKALAQRTPWIPQASWYADPTKAAAPALKVKGAPVVFGVRQGNIEWDLSGVLADEKSLKSILDTWGEGGIPQ